MNNVIRNRGLRPLLWSALIALVATLSFAGGISAANAHAEGPTTSPVDGTQVTSPAVISVTFTEELVLEFSSLSLFDQAGSPVPQEPATLDASGTVMSSVITQILTPGMYRVAWHNLSVDGHEVDGEFHFEVVDNVDPENPATATPEPAVIPEPEMTIDARAYQSTAGDGPTDSGLVTVQIIAWSALGAGVAAGVMALVVVFVRRRRVG